MVDSFNFLIAIKEQFISQLTDPTRIFLWDIRHIERKETRKKGKEKERKGLDHQNHFTVFIK